MIDLEAAEEALSSDLLESLTKRIEELEKAHDKAMADCLEVCKGRDKWIAETRAQIEAVKRCVRYEIPVWEEGKERKVLCFLKDHVFAALGQNNE